MRKLWILLVAVALLLASTVVLAQQEDPEDLNGVYQKVTRYDVEGDVIEGDIWNPRVARIDSLRDRRSTNLVRFRENFRSKVLASAKKL